MNDLSESFLESSVNTYRIACSEFLIYINNIDGKSTKNINHKNLMAYYDQDRRCTVTKNLHIGRIRHFLYYLVDKKLIPTSLPYALNRFTISRIIIIDELSEPDKKAYFHDLDQTSDKISALEYYSIAKQLSDNCLNHHNYAETIKSVFRKTWRELYVFLEANGVRYSSKMAEYWCVCQKSYTCQWRTYRRAIKLLEQYRAFDDIKPFIVYSYKEDPVSKLPTWSRSLLVDFLLKKQKEENAPSTVAMYRSSCLRFLNFLDQEGVKSSEMITPEIIKKFHISDPHSTTEARNAYSVRIRGFLNYLADLGYVAITLHLAMTTKKAPKAKIVETLTDEEITTVYNFLTNAQNPMELRNAATVLLGLRMGLRASDITNIKFSDISWKEQTVSVQQQKTNIFLKLPMPVDVGNSLYRYIMSGRPHMPSDYVFITHRVPHDKLHASCCRRALNKVLDKKGFHITRKTFASCMLKSKTETDTIADSLGHSNNSTVLKYLSTDSNTMRQCALSLKNIEVKGGILS
ncbi:MAG: tyrosine-type recombinase/integrase [Bacteroidetes bacterium]|nr:tyrosine-type recombinase/integrase [Bacteroidota bacterium]